MINIPWSQSNGALETELDASTLQSVVEFCYTHRVYFDGEGHACSVLKAAIGFGIADLFEKCKTYLTTSAASDMDPSIGPKKLVIVGDSREVNCFDAAVLETPSLTADWVELRECISATSYNRRLASIAYLGDDRIAITGGLKGNQPTGVSLV